MGDNTEDRSVDASASPTNAAASTPDAGNYRDLPQALPPADLVALNDPSGTPSTLAFRMIALAGEARSLAMRAIAAAESGGFVDAESLIEQAHCSYDRAHQVQKALTEAHRRDIQPAVDLLLVHAHDHLVMAQMALDNAEILTRLYRRITALEAEPRLTRE
ncbi:PTS lactose/cellobiose transporter subunit IIA [Propionibacterium freudenreichii]|uniref:PTS lactose/cellobiose transporter subunit IIA n=1 Tax=Propionibacterium freudenreichii TaxID=1744 RepID=UPI00101F852F|nr:PTS lactose/cellobiose transporter subunit IIA [Propionibacterium freudenreichii]WFF32675.1 PTS lactose/cellobiose transporter subunit IIA [Propionibacterium freudenreichii]